MNNKRFYFENDNTNRYFKTDENDEIIELSPSNSMGNPYLNEEHYDRIRIITTNPDWTGDKTRNIVGYIQNDIFDTALSKGLSAELLTKIAHRLTNNEGFKQAFSLVKVKTLEKECFKIGGELEKVFGAERIVKGIQDEFMGYKIGEDVNEEIIVPNTFIADINTIEGRSAMTGMIISKETTVEDFIIGNFYSLTTYLNPDLRTEILFIYLEELNIEVEDYFRFIDLECANKFGQWAIYIPMEYENSINDLQGFLNTAEIHFEAYINGDLGEVRYYTPTYEKTEKSLLLSDKDEFSEKVGKAEFIGIYNSIEDLKKNSDKSKTLQEKIAEARELFEKMSNANIKKRN